MFDRVERRERLTPEQKWQVVLEASRKNTTDEALSCSEAGSAEKEFQMVEADLKRRFAYVVEMGNRLPP